MQIKYIRGEGITRRSAAAEGRRLEWLVVPAYFHFNNQVVFGRIGFIPTITFFCKIGRM